jgi:hypothetical protein
VPGLKARFWGARFMMGGLNQRWRWRRRPRRGSPWVALETCLGCNRISKRPSYEAGLLLMPPQTLTALCVSPSAILGSAQSRLRSDGKIWTRSDLSRPQPPKKLTRPVQSPPFRLPILLPGFRPGRQPPRFHRAPAFQLLRGCARRSPLPGSALRGGVPPARCSRQQP